jgi:hypothetical protein
MNGSSSMRMGMILMKVWKIDAFLRLDKLLAME